MPLGTQVGKAVQKVLDTGWAIDVIAPSHGLIWRGDTIAPMLAEYARWTAGEKRDKAVVVFSTMWGSTASLAASITDGITAGGIEVAMYDLAIDLAGAHRLRAPGGEGARSGLADAPPRHALPSGRAPAVP